MFRTSKKKISKSNTVGVLKSKEGDETVVQRSDSVARARTQRTEVRLTSVGKLTSKTARANAISVMRATRATYEVEQQKFIAKQLKRVRRTSSRKSDVLRTPRTPRASSISDIPKPQPKSPTLISSNSKSSSLPSVPVDMQNYANEGIVATTTKGGDESDEESDESSEISSDISSDEEDEPINFQNTLADLNKRFQTLASELFNVKTFSERKTLLQLNEDFIDISKDFLLASSNVGKVIISEVYLPDSNKTIKPINTGGTIGGQKYIIHNILYKFAIRKQGLYDDEVAAKIAGHELKSLVQLWECKVPDLCLPLQCQIDYIGFRLVAMLLLPIDHSTIQGRKIDQIQLFFKVGTSDGGATIHDDNAHIKKLMTKIGKQLNLAPHVCIGDVTIPLAADVEGHVGKDGKKYMLDLSRLFPPQVPTSQTGHLYRLFRPEFVRSYEKPLCSDSFSKFLIKIEDHHKNIQTAQDHLFKKIIPDFGPAFDAKCESALSRKHIKPGFYNFNVTRTIHQKGINLRHIFLLIHHCKSPIAEVLLYIEMVARAVKHILRRKLREKMAELKFPLEMPYIDLIAIFLDNLFSNFCVPQESFEKIYDTIWKCTLENCPAILFDRIHNLMGLVIPLPFLTQIFTYVKSGAIRGLITRHKISSLGEKVKHMNIISHAEGYLMKFAKIPEASQIAAVKFEEALNSSPLNKVSLRNCASCTYNSILKEFGTAGEIPKCFLDYVFDLLDTALAVDPNDTHTLYQYGHLLYELHQYEEAEKYLLLAIKCEPSHMIAWACLQNIYNKTGWKEELKVEVEEQEKVEKMMAAVKKVTRKD